LDSEDHGGVVEGDRGSIVEQPEDELSRSWYEALQVVDVVSSIVRGGGSDVALVVAGGGSSIVGGIDVKSTGGGVHSSSHGGNGGVGGEVECAKEGDVVGNVGDGQEDVGGNRGHGDAHNRVTDGVIESDLVVGSIASLDLSLDGVRASGVVVRVSSDTNVHGLAKPPFKTAQSFGSVENSESRSTNTSIRVIEVVAQVFSTGSIEVSRIARELVRHVEVQVSAVVTVEVLEGEVNRVSISRNIHFVELHIIVVILDEGRQQSSCSRDGAALNSSDTDCEGSTHEESQHKDSLQHLQM